MRALDDPRPLALADCEALERLAAALVARSDAHYQGWGDAVEAAACTAARIGEISGVRQKDIDRERWLWTVRRQTTPGPGGLIDKGTKGKRARTVPLIMEIRPLFAARLDKAAGDDAHLFTGPRGGRISTAVLRDATTGMKSSSSSATSTWCGMTCGTPGPPGWLMRVSRCTSCGRWPGMAR